MPKQVYKTLAVTTGVLATTALGASDVLPISPNKKIAIVLGSQIVLGLLAQFNLYKNPDNTPASQPYSETK